jgi:hypothetical protein
VRMAEGVNGVQKKSERQKLVWMLSEVDRGHAATVCH